MVQPYLPVRGRVGGKVDGQLAIKGSLTPLAVSATGSVIVADGLLADGQRTLATVKRLELAGLNADWPRRVSVERIGVQQHWVLVERNADGSIPLLSALEPPAPAASASTGPPASAAHRESEARHRDRRGGRRGWLRPLRRQHDAAALRRGGVRADVDGAPAGDGARRAEPVHVRAAG